MCSDKTRLHEEVQALYRNHYRWLSRRLTGKIGCAHSAADLAHDAFVRLLGRATPLALREPRAFLATIARSLACNHWRHERIRHDYVAAHAHLSDPLAASPENHALLLETVREIELLLESLPAATRRAFLLARCEGASHAEISARLHVSISTVKRHLARAGACLARHGAPRAARQNSRHASAVSRLRRWRDNADGSPALFIVQWVLL
jgi:RNA polymerase sigma factor (sigma-70 family)